MPGGPLSDVQASVPYFRHVDEGEVQGSSKHGAQPLAPPARAAAVTVAEPRSNRCPGSAP